MIGKRPLILNCKTKLRTLGKPRRLGWRKKPGKRKKLGWSKRLGRMPKLELTWNSPNSESQFSSQPNINHV